MCVEVGQAARNWSSMPGALDHQITMKFFYIENPISSSQPLCKGYRGSRRLTSAAGTSTWFWTQTCDLSVTGAHPSGICLGWFTHSDFFWPLIILWAGFRAQTCVFTANKDDKYVKRKSIWPIPKAIGGYLLHQTLFAILCILHNCPSFFWLKVGFSRLAVDKEMGALCHFPSCSRSKGERESICRSVHR